ncbi:MAG: hypothetical protein V7K26_30940 [Nostoc sp.]
MTTPGSISDLQMRLFASQADYCLSLHDLPIQESDRKYYYLNT